MKNTHQIYGQTKEHFRINKMSYKKTRISKAMQIKLDRLSI